MGESIVYCRAFGILQEHSGCTEGSPALLKCHSQDEKSYVLGSRLAASPRTNHFIPLHPVSVSLFGSTSPRCRGEW